MNTKTENSALIQTDTLTEGTYKRNGFNPATEVTQFSYTSGRVAKRVYNAYQPTQGEDFTVFGYYTDWSQYDGRLETPSAENAQCGRGVDLTLLNYNAYDKLIIGFLGVVGDQGEKKDTIEAAATCDTYDNLPDVKGFCRSQYQVTFTDPWGDVLAYRNCGFEKWVSNDVPTMFYEDKAQGVLGGLRELKKKNPNLRLGMSIGGWTMSNIFSSLSRNQAQRKIFIDSILDILERFPMFTDLDIDWEYPGMPGNNNPYAEDDAEYFQVLVRELRVALDGVERNDVKISIATNAGVKGLEKADIAGMIEAGVDGINLMTYDYFGTPWANNLAHHTNLHPNGQLVGGDEFSIEQAVDYLEDQGVDLKKVFIGYAAYSRSAKNAEISNFSPLQGSYNPETGTTTGSFESGASEWYDVIYNYLDLESQCGRNGYNVYTDEVADADYLYNPDNKHFLSIDTPRSVKAKGEYVRSRGLGGLFTWTIDMDNGVLVNAAREGLGYTVSTEVVDMEPFYFKGINVAQGPKAKISGETLLVLGDTIALSGAQSEGAVSFLWSAPGLPFDGSTAAEVSAPADTVGSFTVSLTVSDADNNADTANITLQVRDPDAIEPPQAQIALQLEAGVAFALCAQGTAEQGQTCIWTAPGLAFDGSDQNVVKAVAPTVSETTDFSITLDVSNGVDSKTDVMLLTVLPTEGGEDGGDGEDDIPQWQAQNYPTAGTQVRHNYQGQGEKVYQNNWYAEATNEPGNPECTGGVGSGKVWSEVTAR